MDQNNEPEAKVSKEETRALLTTDLGTVPLLLTRIFLQDLTLQMGTLIRIMEDHTINAEVSTSTEAMETNLEMDLLAIRMETGETVEDFAVLLWLKGEIFREIIHTVNQEVINLTILPSAGLTIDLWVVLRFTNKSFLQTIIRLHLIWFVLRQLTTPLTNYQTFARETAKVSEIEHR